MQIHPVLNVPYYSQRNNHRWREMGFPDAQTARHWERRSCGVACVKMVLEAFERPVSSYLYELLMLMRDKGAYLPGTGWIHQGLLDFCKEYGLIGFRQRVFNPLEIIPMLKAGYLAIVSIGPCFENRKKSGHLALVVGAVEEGGLYTHLLVHHPSSDEKYEYQNHPIEIPLFGNHFSGNVIALRAETYSS